MHKSFCCDLAVKKATFAFVSQVCPVSNNNNDIVYFVHLGTRTLWEHEQILYFVIGSV